MWPRCLRFGPASVVVANARSANALPGRAMVIGTVLLALLCALYCKCGDRIYTTGNGPNRRYNNEQEPLIVEGKPISPP